MAQTEEREQQSVAEGNKQVVRTFFETVSAGDLEGVRRLLDERATWTVVASDIPGAGTHAGRDEIIDGFLGPVRDLFEPGDPKLEIDNIFGEGSWVAIEATGRGRFKNGNPYNQSYCFMIEIEGGKVRTLREYFDSGYVSRQV